MGGRSARSCFFNNAAIAAQHLVESAGSKVTVLDVDYHHGNGAQQIFHRRGDVQYVSLHGDPTRAHPYISGRAAETGAGDGAGANLDVPLAVGTDDPAHLTALGAACEAIDAFGSEPLIVSLGVDGFHNDPISDSAVTTDGFREQAELVAQLGLPVVVLQEGGYDVAAIGDDVAAIGDYVRAFLLGVTSRV